jgi:hypothetical protein
LPLLAGGMCSFVSSPGTPHSRQSPPTLVRGNISTESSRRKPSGAAAIPSSVNARVRASSNCDTTAATIRHLLEAPCPPGVASERMFVDYYGGVAGRLPCVAIQWHRWASERDANAHACLPHKRCKPVGKPRIGPRRSHLADSLLTSELGDSDTNLRTRRSTARHDATGSDSGGPENIGPVIGQGQKMSRNCEPAFTAAFASNFRCARASLRQIPATGHGPCRFLAGARFRGRGRRGQQRAAGPNRPLLTDASPRRNAALRHGVLVVEMI